MPDKGEAILCLVADWGGRHPSAWRDADAPNDPPMNFDYIRRVAQTAERGKFHGLFLADSPAVGFLGHQVTTEALSRTHKGVRGPEPLTLLAALSAHTEHLGLLATASTTYCEPFNVARMFASLDFLSGGRAGWNAVATASTAAALNFGREEHLGHAERYDRAQEFVDVVTGLWNSWEDDAFLNERDSGRYFDPDKLHALNYHGKYFSAAGPLDISRSPQGQPVIVQAGSSGPGRAFAARNAEVVFTLQADPEKGKSFYTEVKEEAAAFGRDPGQVKVLPGLALIVGHSEAHAQEKLEHLDSLVPEEVGREMLLTVLGRDVDLSAVALDDPVPDVPMSEVGSQGAQKYFLDMVRRENLTVRQAMGRSTRTSAHTVDPTGAADIIEEWLEAGAADGFNLMFADAVDSLEIFVDKVVPELQRRNLFHTEYRGKTLRENLGLSRPTARHGA
ncbi:LLM class flavin-dependent oxidoreductase [Rhodococcus sp. T2V]|uniref:LLM class flavin-dependent oxidoreductase n=1 Tax=Rhodococcus sp. T2V TaxID=3034164 RepID=UPI0023E2E0FC|nr:LLM class flavin-dependent oxidoreductase [Rhodococcus sp. T2V]MDF3311167.1 LLM class flavin-dependent oxidoreductase [Rhodococcus sp. T2V]